MANKRSAYSLDAVGFAAAIVTAFGWGIAGVFIKNLPNISALSLVSMRLTLALITLVFILSFRRKELFKHMVSLGNPVVLGASFLLLTCYSLGTLSFQLAPVGEATLLMAIAPLFVVMFKIFIREKTYKNEFLGVVFAIGGISIIFLPSFFISNIFSVERIIGDALAVFVSVIFAILALWIHSLKKKNKAPETLSIALGTFVMGFIMGVYIAQQQVSELYKFGDIKTIISLISLGLLSTAIPTFTYGIATKRLAPLMTTSILLFEPIFAIIFAFIILNEIPSFRTAPGIFFIFAGLILISRRTNTS